MRVLRSCRRRCLPTRPQGEFSLTKMFDRANEQERLFGLRLDGVWMHVGTPDAVAGRGRGVSGERGVSRRSSVVVPAKAGIQYAAASRFITSASGILDHPLSRVMTVGHVAAHDQSAIAPYIGP